MVSMSLAEVLAHQAKLAHKHADENPTPTNGPDEESAFHDEIMSYLRRAGIRGVVHSRMDKASTQAKGVPDFLFAVEGVPVALEAKVKGRKVTPEQAGWLTALRLDGWITSVVRSIKDVAHVLGQAREKLDKPKSL